MPNPSEEKTEDKIIKSFKKLVNEYSFDKITVTMIAEEYQDRYSTDILKTNMS